VTVLKRSAWHMKRNDFDVGDFHVVTILMSD
jgi:hypothetical protein